MASKKLQKWARRVTAQDEFDQVFAIVREAIKSRWTMTTAPADRETLWIKVHLLDEVKGEIEELGSDRNNTSGG